MSGIGLFNILGAAYEENQRLIKEASEKNTLALPERQQEKTASAQNDVGDSSYIQKLAEACLLTAEALEKVAVKQPVSSVGPKDNENMSIGSGYFTPNTAQKLKTGNTPDEHHRRGNSPGTNEERSGLNYTGSSSALTKKAEPVKDALKKFAYRVQIERNGGLASKQPVSEHGPRDNESGHKPANISGGVLAGDSYRVAHLRAQDLVEQAQSKDFPFTEPQAYELTAESGWGPGTTDNAMGGPVPNKLASAKDFLKSLRGAN